MVDPAADDTKIEIEKIRLIEADLAQTNEFVKGVLGTGAAIRGSAITIWLALLGFSVQQTIPTLALLAALVSVAFWIADGYHGWLYGEAFGHAQKIESLLASYCDDLSRRSDSTPAHVRFTAKLRAHRYGLYSGLSPGFNPKQLWSSARPRIFYRGLYPAIISIALVIATVGYMGVDLRAIRPGPTRVMVEQSGPAPTPTPVLPAETRSPPVQIPTSSQSPTLSTTRTP